MIKGNEIDNKTLSGRVYDLILDLIIEGKLKVNEKICTEDIAQKYGVSRTPVREALKLLEKTGLVEFKSYSGTHVRKLPVSEIQEIYNIRMILETYAIEKVIEKVTPEDIKALEEIQQRIEKICREDPANIKSIYDTNAEFHMRMYAISGMPRLCEIINTLWINLSFYRFLSAGSKNYTAEMIKEHHEYINCLKTRAGEEMKKRLRHNLELHAERAPQTLEKYYSSFQ